VLYVDRRFRASISIVGHGDTGDDHSQAKAVSGRPATGLASSRLETTWPRALPGATRSGIALGLSPAGPFILGPYPLEGRSTDCALDLDRANAAPGSYVQVRAFVPAPLAAGRSRLNPAQARRSSSGAAHARRTGDCRGAGQVCYPSASAADAAACWMPTLGGRVAWPR
jgi:hypothetical protein